MGPQTPDMGSSDGFPMRLKAAMELRGYSHRRLANAIGASQNSVTNWTRGHNEPSLRHLRSISRELDVSLSELLEEDRHRPLEDRASSLVRELAAQPIGPAVQILNESAPDLLDLLGQAERYVKDLEGKRGKS
jgi:transcriptional regulator with XRE-family HTH domain